MGDGPRLGAEYALLLCLLHFYVESSRCGTQLNSHFACQSACQIACQSGWQDLADQNATKVTRAGAPDGALFGGILAWHIRNRRGHHVSRLKLMTLQSRTSKRFHMGYLGEA